MEKNDILLDGILSGIQVCKPQLDHPEKTVNEVLSRINVPTENKTAVMGLRTISVAATLLLLVGIATIPDDDNANDTALQDYQNKFLSQKADMYYIKSKLAEKQLYDIIKQQTPYEKNR